MDEVHGTSPEYGVRLMAFYTQAQGTPNWWLDHHGVSEGYDAGDGVAAWRKYAMDVDLTVSDNYLHITAVSDAPAETDVAFTPASTRRYYTLIRREDLTEGAWGKVAGQVAVEYGAAGEQTMQDTNRVKRSLARSTWTSTK